MNADQSRPENDTTATPEQAERLGRRVSESAQQVWLAGLGAFSLAQSEGSRLFDSLVKEGKSAEERSRHASAPDSGVQDNVESTLGQARERASGAWDRVEKSFEERMQRILRRMDIPGRSDIEALNARLEALEQRLAQTERQDTKPQTTTGPH